jgi:ribonucleoside-diphosphate reductase alpha chain
MKLTKNGQTIINRFLLKDKKGKIIEKPEDLFKRVAHNIAKEDKKYGSTDEEFLKIEKTFYNSMQDLEFLPNLPVIANAGRKLQQLAACFVIPVSDDIPSIFQSVKEMAIIQKSGGGTGFNFSKLRPEGSLVSETGGIASGPVSFMKVFDSATGAIKEGGIRRGANMGILRIDHPDIEKFINCKSNNELSNFNISTAINEKFMEAVIKNKEFELEFDNKIYSKVKAKELFQRIANQAWSNGDPGIIFIDEINKHNTTPEVGIIEATNPCGEQPLLPYESCFLGSINLEKFVKEKSKKIDYEKLEETIKSGVHFLDNCIDATKYPISAIERITKHNRKIGLGVMGFAGMLIKMNIAYDSQTALKLAEKIMKFVNEKAREASKELAEKRGSFMNLNKSIWKENNIKMRNATVTTIAPTGTIGIIADCTEGIEPLFGLATSRKSTYGELLEINPLFQELTKKLKLKKEVLTQIMQENSLQNKEIKLPKKIKRIFKTAHDIEPEWHIKIQAAFQKYTDNAISKTVNLKETATPEDIEKIFMLAYKLKCKGLTVYRYNSRKEQVLDFCKACKI